MVGSTLILSISTLICGLLALFLSLPLIFRKVPMNKTYGVRFKASFESNERWYEINAYGGRQMAAWSLPIIATGIAGFFIPGKYEVGYFWISTAVVLICVLIPAAATWWKFRK